LFGGEWQPPEPVAFKAYMGGSPADFLWTGFPPLFCVSQRVIDLLEENQFTGWSTYPVEVYDRHGGKLPGYHDFAITGSAVRRDLSRSQIITKPARTSTRNLMKSTGGFISMKVCGMAVTFSAFSVPQQRW